MKKEDLWEKQQAALRDPQQIIANDLQASGIIPQSLTYNITYGFLDLLEKQNITLFVTREYEHLVVALNVKDGKLRQSFMHLPHPSGLAVDSKTNSLYIIATRNPNQIWEFRPMKGVIERKEIDTKVDSTTHYLMPSRVKYLRGSYYMHDLAFIQDKLYVNSVGQNAIAEVDFMKDELDLVWWPKSVDMKGNPDTTVNYIQLNSIAAGDSLEKSYFSASSSEPAEKKPGDVSYPVDKRGVIFSGKTRDVFATGLTRPHSARIYKGKVWVDNSGYGEVGYIDRGQFIPTIKLPGWTRGLYIYKDVMYVGISRVLPRFRAYAPGIKEKKQTCAVYAINMKTMQIIGTIEWPYGNQIFAIDSIDSKISTGFLYEKAEKSTKEQQNIFYSYTI